VDVSKPPTSTKVGAADRIKTKQPLQPSDGSGGSAVGIGGAAYQTELIAVVRMNFHRDQSERTDAGSGALFRFACQPTLQLPANALGDCRRSQAVAAPPQAALQLAVLALGLDQQAGATQAAASELNLESIRQHFGNEGEWLDLAFWWVEFFVNVEFQRGNV
jgi:hypothetical protein